MRDVVRRKSLKYGYDQVGKLQVYHFSREPQAREAYNF